MEHKKDKKSQTTIDILSFTFYIWKNLYLVPKKLQKNQLIPLIIPLIPGQIYQLLYLLIIIIFVSGRGNLIFCINGHQNSYFGLVSQQNNSNNQQLQGRKTENKNIGHRV